MLNTGLLMKWRKRYYLPWIYSSIFMFGLSFLWHGYILNDFSELPYSIELFFILSGVVYISIGFAITMAAIKLSVHKNKLVNGLLLGSVFGFFLYLIAFVLGVSFSRGSGLEHIMVDIVWQMLEQAIGGGIAGFLYHFYKEMAKIQSFQE